MSKYIHLAGLLIGLFLGAYPIQAQSLNDSLRSFYLEKRYSEAIQLIKSEKQLDDRGFFYAGMCYYAQSQDSKAVYCFDKAVKMNSEPREYYLYRGLSLSFLGKTDLALANFNRLTRLGYEKAQVYAGKGDVFMQLKQIDSALVNYQKASTFDDCPDKSFIRIGEIYEAKGNLDLATKAFYLAKSKVNPKSNYYPKSLFSIGQLEYRQRHFDEAAQVILELLSLFPDDYIAIEKLIQIYYAQQNFVEAKKWKEKLYKAHQAGEIKEESLREMFCFDQFMWRGHRVLAFEKFDTPDENLFYKHYFYLQSPEGKVLYTVQTEHSFSVRVGGNYYVLGKTEGNIHYTYMDLLYAKDFNYPKLRQGVMDIFSGKAKTELSTQVK